MKLFIVRASLEPPDVQIQLVRSTPSIVRSAEDQRDYFCLGDDATIERLTADGWLVVPVQDGWYDDDTGGGVAVWGNGRYFELRDTLFSVRPG